MDLSPLRQELESIGTGKQPFSITIQSADGIQRIMNCIAEVNKGSITFVSNIQDDGYNCIYLPFTELGSTFIQHTDECTTPTLPSEGNLQFLTDVKLQLIFGLTDLTSEEITMGDGATIKSKKGTSIELTPYKLVRFGTMSYSKFGFRPTDWFGDYEIFVNRLLAITFGELSDELKDTIRLKIKKVNPNTNVSTIMKQISIDNDDGLSEDIVKYVFNQLIKNKKFHDNDTLHFDSLTELTLDPDLFAKYRYANTIISYDLGEIENSKSKNNINKRNNTNNNNSNNNYLRNNNPSYKPNTNMTGQQPGFNYSLPMPNNPNNYFNLGGGRRRRKQRTVKRKTKRTHKQTRRRRY